MNYNRKAGILCILLSAFFFSMMSIFVKLAGDIPTMQKSLFRNLIAAGIAVISLARSGEPFRIHEGCLKDLLLRSFFGTVGILANFWAIDHLILADANMLNKLSPFFAIIMSVFILKEVPSRFDWFSIILCFTGALFVIRPTAGVASLPALVGGLGGLGAGTAYTYVRKLGNMGERPLVIVLFFSSFSCLAVLPFVIADFHPMSGRQLLMLLLAGLSAAGGQLSVTSAYRFAPAKEISIFDYTQILWAALFGMLIFHTMPDRLSLLGYAIIIGSALLRWRHDLSK